MKKARKENDGLVSRMIKAGPKRGVRLWESKAREVPVEKIVLQLLRRLPVRDTKLTEWLDHLAFGANPDETRKEISSLSGGSAACAHVFKQNEPAYQCRTCGIDTTCVQCMACFKLSDHTGHEILMTHAGGGGCCDCGDPSSWDIKGTCSMHNGKNTVPSRPMPASIANRAKPVIEYAVEILSRALSGVCPRGLDAGGDSKSVRGSAYTGYIHMAFGEMISINKDEVINPEEDHLFFSFLNDDSHNSFDAVINTLCETILDETRNSGVPIQEVRLKAFQVANQVNGRGRALIQVSSRKRADGLKTLIRGYESLNVTVEAMGPNDAFLTLERLNSLVEWLGDLCNISDSFRDLQCDRLLLRFKEGSPEPPGIHGIQPGDWVVAHDLSDRTYNGKLGVVNAPIRPQRPGQSPGSRRVPIRYIHIPEKVKGVKVVNVRKTKDPGIKLTSFIGSLWKDSKSSVASPRVQVISTIPAGLIPGSTRGFVISDGKHLTFADFSRCQRPPKNYEMIILKEFKTSRIDGKHVVLCSEFDTIRLGFESIIGQPRSVDCSAGDDAQGLPPHWLSMIFKYNLSIPTNIWQRLTPWFFRLFVNQRFKECFTVGFATHYSGLISEHAHLGGLHQFSFLAYGVQVLTIPSMTPRVARVHGLLRAMIGTVTHQILRTLRDRPGLPMSRSRQRIPRWFDLTPRPCLESSEAMIYLEHLLGTLRVVIRDMEYVVRNKGACELFFQGDCSLLRQWMGFLNMLESMDVNKRASREHVQYENKTWKAAFSLSFRLAGVTNELLKTFRSLIDQPNGINALAGRHIVEICMSTLLYPRGELGRGSNYEDGDLKRGRVMLVLPSRPLRQVEAETVSDGPEKLSFHFPARRLAVRLISNLLRVRSVNSPILRPILLSYASHEQRTTPPLPIKTNPKLLVFSKGATVEVWWEWSEIWMPGVVVDSKENRVLVRYATGREVTELITNGRKQRVRKCTRRLTEGIPALAEGLEPMLKAIAGLTHINAQLWVRNGNDTMKSQILNYAHVASTHSGMYLADLSAFQLATVALGPDAAIALLAYHFRLHAYFELSPLENPYPKSTVGENILDDEGIADEELRSVTERKLVKSWGDKLPEVVYGFLLSISHAITDRRIAGEVNPCDVLARDIVHILAKASSTHSQVATAVDQDVKDAHPSLFEKTLREVANLTENHALSSSGEWEVKAESLRKYFNPYCLMYKTEDRQVAEEKYKQIIEASRRKRNKVASPRESSAESIDLSDPYPPTVSYPALLETYSGLYGLLASSLLMRIIYFCLNRALSASTPANPKLEKKYQNVDLGESCLGLTLHILALGVSDIDAGHLSTDVRERFFLNLSAERTRGSKGSILATLKALKDVAIKGQGSALLKESTPLIHWIISKCRALDTSGKCKDDDGSDQKMEVTVTKKKLSKRERRMAAAKARKRKIMQKMAKKRREFETENKEAMQKEKEKAASRKDGGLESLTCIVCRTDNSSQPLGLVTYFSKSHMMGLAYDEKASGPSCDRLGDGRGHGLLGRFCGHAMHWMCRDAYFANLVLKSINGQHYSGLKAIDVGKGEFVCPLCEAPANDLVIIPELTGPSTSGERKEGPEGAKNIKTRIEEHRGKMTLPKISTITDLPTVDCLAYSIRSTDLAYRERAGISESDESKRKQIWSMMKPREVSGLSCMLGSMASAIPLDSTATSDNSEAQAGRSLLSGLEQVFGLGSSSKGSVGAMLGFDVDTFRLVLLAAIQSFAKTKNPMNDPKYCALKTSAFSIRVAQALMHSMSVVPKGEKITKAPEKLMGLSKLIIKHIKEEKVEEVSFSEVDFLSHLLPFLRQVSILEHCLFYLHTKGNIPNKDVKSNISSNSKEELTALTLMRSEASDLMKALSFPNPSRLGDTQALKKVTSWIEGLKVTTKFTANVLRGMRSPRLIELPKTYQELFIALSDGVKSLGPVTGDDDKKEGRSMKVEGGTQFRNPAVCLLTGKVLDMGKGRLSKHTQAISPNAGVFLFLRNTKVLIISHGYGIFFGSVYVDSHGEMDIGLLRGHMLYLDQNRLKALEDLVVEQRVTETVARLRMRHDPGGLSDRNYY